MVSKTIQQVFVLALCPCTYQLGSIVGILRLFLGVVSKTIQQLFVLGFGSVTDMLTRVNYFF